MIGAWGIFVRKALLDSGRSPFAALVGECVASLSSLLFYWLTSRAIGPALSFSGDYFTFVVIGEATLLIPLTLWGGVTQSIRSGVSDGTLELFLTLPVPAPLLAAFQAAAHVPREVFGLAVTWTVAAVVFGLSVSAWRIAELIALQLFAVPLFLGIGLMAGAALVRFGRGQAVLAHIGTFAAVLSGAYFPLSALPDPVRQWSLILSPFTWVMETARSVIAVGWTVETTKAAAAWVGVGVLALALGWAALEWSFAHVRRRGDPLLLPQ